MTFSFLNLPAEIRNAIFRLLLTHKIPIIARSCNDLKPPYPVSLGLFPNICLVSRAVYGEASSILYGENTFQAHPTFLTSAPFAMDHERFVKTRQSISHIRRWHLRVRLDCDPFYGSEEVLQAFNGAEELEIEVFRASWGIGSYDVLEPFTKIRGVRRAKVHGSLWTRYAKWLENTMMSGSGIEVDCWSDEALQIPDR